MVFFQLQWFWYGNWLLSKNYEVPNFLRRVEWTLGLHELMALWRRDSDFLTDTASGKVWCPR